MKQKIEFDKKDMQRIILTETLPYECPFIFSNEHFYRRLHDGLECSSDKITACLVTELKGATIPYTYSIRLDDEKTRTLNLPHPNAQLRVRDFYQEYYAMIIDRCSPSAFSLRRPTRLAEAYYEPNPRKSSDELKSDDVEALNSDYDPQPRFSSSFFVYQTCGRLFEFFDSYEFLDLEKRFKKMAFFDVAKCFYNIYTHTLPWAIKGKRFSKENTKRSTFENNFDELMQNCNHKETNGILVGPEFSRLFAEIIFQAIDTEVERTLSEKEIIRNRDFTVKRYIDDHFIFSNSELIINQVVSTYENTLASYNLYLNHTKSYNRRRPFVSSMSSAKQDIFDLLDDFFSRAVYVTERDANGRASCYSLNQRSPGRWSSKELIDRYRNLINSHEVGYSQLSSLFLGTIRHRLHDISKNIKLPWEKKGATQYAIRFLAAMIKVAYFVVSVDFRSRTVDIASQLLVLTDEIAYTYYTPLARRVVKENIRSEFSRIFLTPDFLDDIKKSRFEFFTLLVVVKSLTKAPIAGEKTLEDIWRKSKNSAAEEDDSIPGFPYFEAVCLIHVYGKKASKSELVNEVLDDLIEKVKTNSFPRCAATAMAVLDAMACPYIDGSKKKEIANAVCFSLYGDTKNKNEKIAEFQKYAEGKYWFVDWSEEIDIKKALFKKELRSSY